MKKILDISVLVVVLFLAACADKANSEENGSASDVLVMPDADSLNYVSRMLFVTQGETDLKVTYDGVTWEYYHSASLKEETWFWYTFEEFEEYMGLMATIPSHTGPGLRGVKISMPVLEQTLVDIKNGIRVSKNKPILVSHLAGPVAGFDRTAGYIDFHPGTKLRDTWIEWYCFGYTFKDKYGNTVDLGLFETRDELFAALRLCYDKEVQLCRMTQPEADGLYSQIAHSIRYADEVPLVVKLSNAKAYIPLDYKYGVVGAH